VDPTDAAAAPTQLLVHELITIAGFKSSHLDLRKADVGLPMSSQPVAGRTRHLSASAEPLGPPQGIGRPPQANRATVTGGDLDRQRPWSPAVRATQLGGYLAPPRGHHANPRRSGSPPRSGPRPGPRPGCQLHTDPADRLGSRATCQLPLQRHNRGTGRANRQRLSAYRVTIKGARPSIINPAIPATVTAATLTTRQLAA